MNNSNPETELEKNSFGLTERDRITIERIFKKYPEITQVHLFGSRAKGTFKRGSDIDLAIITETVSEETILKLKVACLIVLILFIIHTLLILN
jgi:predicted nucleotidyltransferase